MLRFILILLFCIFLICGCQFNSLTSSGVIPSNDSTSHSGVTGFRSGSMDLEYWPVTFEKIYPDHFFKVNDIDYTPNVVGFPISVRITRDGGPPISLADIIVTIDGYDDVFILVLNPDGTLVITFDAGVIIAGEHTLWVNVYNGSPLGASLYWYFVADPIPPQIINVLLDEDTGLMWVFFDKPHIELPDLEIGTYITVNGQQNLTSGDKISPLNVNLRTTHVGGIPPEYYENGMIVSFDQDPRGPTSYVVYTPKQPVIIEREPCGNGDCSCAVYVTLHNIHHFQETENNAICWEYQFPPNHCEAILKWELYSYQLPWNQEPAEAGWGTLIDPYTAHEWIEDDDGYMKLDNPGIHTYIFDSQKNIRFRISIWGDCDTEIGYETELFNMPEPWEFNDMDTQPPWFFHLPEIHLGNEAADRLEQIVAEMGGPESIMWMSSYEGWLQILRNNHCNWWLIATAADWHGGHNDGGGVYPGDPNKKRGLEPLVSGFIESKWRNRTTGETIEIYPEHPGMMVIAFVARKDFQPLWLNEHIYWDDPNPPYNHEFKNDGNSWNEGELYLFDITEYMKTNQPGEDYDLVDLRLRIEDWMPSIAPPSYPPDPPWGNWRRSSNLVENLNLNYLYIEFDPGSPAIGLYDPTWQFNHYPQPEGDKLWIRFTVNCPCNLTIYLDDYTELPNRNDAWGEDGEGVTFLGGNDEWGDFVLPGDDYDLDGSPDLTPISAAIHNDSNPLDPDYPGLENDVFAWDGCGARDDIKHPEKDLLWNDIYRIEDLEFGIDQITQHFTIEYDGRQKEYVVPGDANHTVIPMYIPPGLYQVKYVAVDPLSSNFGGIVQKSINPSTLEIAYPSAAVLFPDSTYTLHHWFYPDTLLDFFVMEEAFDENGICYSESHGVNYWPILNQPYHPAYPEWPYSDHFVHSIYGAGGFYPHNYYTFPPFHSILTYFGHYTNFKKFLENIQPNNYQSLQSNQFDLVYLRTCWSYGDYYHFNYKIFVGWNTRCAATCMNWSSIFWQALSEDKSFYEAECIADTIIKSCPYKYLPEEHKYIDPAPSWGLVRYSDDVYKQWHLSDLQSCN